MEAIKQYIESMFMSLPNNEDVMKAKAHLLEMAEDKYTSLMEEGMSDNEAVGRVISEFGNLDELKEELGIADKVDWEEQNKLDIRTLSFAEIKALIKDFKTAAVIKALGIFAIVSCIAPAIFASNISEESETSVMVWFFLSIGIGIVMLVVQGAIKKNWMFVEYTRCAIDLQSAEHVMEDQRESRVLRATLRTLGVLMIIFCFIPSYFFMPNKSGAALIFWMIGGGVMLLTYCSGIEKLYDLVLGINPKNTVGGLYSKGSGRVYYKNENLAAVMSVYWAVMVCAYLSVSFMTFAWGITWIVFPVAALVHKFIEEAFGERE